MYKAYWGMEFNPFEKGLSEKNFFQSHDFSQAMSRLEHLKNIKGIGLFTGLSGSGITVIVGKSEYGNFACIPDWSAGCYLSSLRDTFWNQERLTNALGTVDGITVAKALYSLADHLKF